MKRCLPTVHAALAALLLACAAAPALANCVTTRTGETVCPAPDSRCQADRYGDWKCSAPGGDVTIDFHGNVVCGAGQCVKNIHQEVMCSTQSRGGAALDRYGQAVCAGGCALARADACTPLKR